MLAVLEARAIPVKGVPVAVGAQIGFGFKNRVVAALCPSLLLSHRAVAAVLVEGVTVERVALVIRAVLALRVMQAPRLQG